MRRLPSDTAAVVTAVALVGAAAAGAWTGSRGVLAAGAALAALPHALLFVGAAPRGSVRAALGVGALVGLAFVATGAPALSDDVHRYLWDGRVLGAGLDPYRHAPADPALAALRDALWARVNHPEVATIYPPLAQLLFVAVDAAWHDPRAFQLAALGAHLGAAALAARLAGAPRARRVAWIVALHPLAVVESAGSGHIDAAVGLAFVATALALAAGRPLRAGLAAGAAAGLKLVGLLAAPLLLRRSRPAGLLAVVAFGVSLAPLLGAGAGSREPGGLTQYTARWRGNAGPYELLERGAAAALAPLRDGDHLRLPGLGPAVVPEALRGGPADPLRTVRPAKKEPLAALPFELAVGLGARALAGALALGVAVAAARWASTPAGALRAALLAALLLAPQVHPWYLLWLLPLEAAAGRVAGSVWAVAALGGYAATDAWIAARVWAEPPGFRVAEYALVLTAVALEAWASRPGGAGPAASRTSERSEGPGGRSALQGGAPS